MKTRDDNKDITFDLDFLKVGSNGLYFFKKGKRRKLELKIEEDKINFLNQWSCSVDKRK